MTIDEMTIVSAGEAHLLVDSAEAVGISNITEDSVIEKFRHSVITVEEMFGCLLHLYKLDVWLGVKLYIHDYRKVLKKGPDGAWAMNRSDLYDIEHRQACLGVISAGKDRSYYLDGSLRLGDEEAVEEWIDACSVGLWSEPELTTERAKELAKAISGQRMEAEGKSLATLRRTLGDEVADKLLKEGKIAVKSANGREYVITDSGEVFCDPYDEGMDRICVEVKDEESLPKYDRVLAKYLVIRDHPEQIETLQGRGDPDRDGSILGDVIARVHANVEQLERRLSEINLNIIMTDTPMEERRRLENERRTVERQVALLEGELDDLESMFEGLRRRG